MNETSTGADLIMAERLRQIHGEKFDDIRDDEYTDEELAKAAVAYAMPNSMRPQILSASPPITWPWPEDTWKPGDRISDLKKAEALIAAEIDRLIRLEAT